MNGHRAELAHARTRMLFLQGLVLVVFVLIFADAWAYTFVPFRLWPMTLLVAVFFLNCWSAHTVFIELPRVHKEWEAVIVVLEQAQKDYIDAISGSRK